MRFNIENHKHIDQLETAITRITSPVDKLQLKQQPQSVPGRDAVGALHEASKALESIETVPNMNTKTVEVDKQSARQRLQVVDAKLETAQLHLENLDKNQIADHKMTSFKGAVFESFGQNSRLKLPQTFKRYENQPIIDIVRSLRKEIQAEL